MVTTGLSLFLTVFILHLNYKTHNTPVPRWLNFLLCMKRRKIDTNEEEARINSISDSMMNNNGKVGSFEHLVEKTTGLRTNKEQNDNAKRKENIQEEWKEAVKRIDHGFFFLFVIIFSLLLLIMIYPYDNEVVIDKNAKCQFGS